MSKLFLGNRLADLDIGEPSLPVSKVILNVDSETYYQSGDDTGATVEANCPWATQAMADSVLAQIKGFVYKPFSGYDAFLDPSAELGDAITVGGHYGVLAQMGRSLDRRAAATVGAPGIDEIEDEYPYKTKQRKETDRVLAKAYARISKTSEEIRLEVQNEVESLSSAFTVELEAIRAEIVGLENAYSEMELSLDGLITRIQDAEGNIAELELTTQGFGVSIEGLEDDYTELALTLDGLTVTDSSGTTRIKGSSIETDTLYVNAANILGTLSAGQINMSGAITWNDLSSGVQSTINGAYSAGLDEDDVTTLITSTLVSSPTIAGGAFGDLAYGDYVGGESVNTSWIKMGSSVSGDTHIGYLYQYYSGYSDTAPICRMGYYAIPGYNDQWVLAPFGYIALSYLLDDVGTLPGKTTYAQGNWNFSQATVTGLNISSDITVTAVWG